MESQTSQLLQLSPFAFIFSYNDCGRLDLIIGKKIMLGVEYVFVYGFLQKRASIFREPHKCGEARLSPSHYTLDEPRKWNGASNMLVTSWLTE